MNDIYVIDRSEWLACGAMLVLFTLGCLGIRWTIKAMKAVRLASRIAETWKDSHRDRALIRFSGLRAVGWRAVFTIGCLYLAWVCFLNSYCWFRMIDVRDKTLMLGYSWPRNSTVIKASEIASVATLRNRNNRINLLITTKSGKAFRSVATDQAELAQEIRSAIQELQTTDGRQNTDTPTIAPAAPTNF